MITPFKRYLFTSEISTTTVDPGWETLLTVAVPVGELGTIRATLTATVQCQYTEEQSNFLGAAVRALWDDEPLPEVGYIEFDPAFGPPNVDTFAAGLPFVAIIEDAPPGGHTLEIQWQVIAPDEMATIFPNCGQLTIEGVV